MKRGKCGMASRWVGARRGLRGLTWMLARLLIVTGNRLIAFGEWILSPEESGRP